MELSPTSPIVSGIVGPVVNGAIAQFGALGLLFAVLVVLVIWWTKASSGLRAEQELTIGRQTDRIASLVDQLEKEKAAGLKWRESYYAVKYPGSDHEDVAEKTGMDKEQPHGE